MKKNTYAKKIFSMLIVFAMLLGTLPISSIAVENTSFNKNDVIEFGSYPQTIVTDESLILELTNRYEKLEPNLFYDRGYASYVYETIVEYNNEKYLGLFLEHSMTAGYAPSTTEWSDYSFDHITWFKCEPIKWIVLDSEKGLLISQQCISAHCHNDKNYLESIFREWLNSYFLYEAFLSSEIACLKEIDVSQDNTGIYELITMPTVALVTKMESTLATATDYAKNFGISITKDCCAWYLGDGTVYRHGDVSSSFPTNQEILGMRPVICLDFAKYQQQKDSYIDFSVEKLELDLYGTTQLKVETSSDIAKDSLIFTSSDKNIVSVDNQGNIKGLASGTAEIFVTANDIEASCEVNIVSPTNIPEGFTPIYTVDDFLKVRKNTSGKYILMDNIDMSETSWGNRVGFYGILDGNDYIINGLTNALFSTLSNAEIRNLNLTNVSIKTSAAIAQSITNSTLKNISVSNLVCEYTNYGTFGGLIDSAESSMIDNCNIYADININGSTGQTLHVGGIVGEAEFTSIRNCYAGGKLNTTSSYNAKDYASGIVYSSSGTNTNIINCYNNMTISGKNVYGISASNIVGLPIKYCVNTGTLKAGLVLVNEQHKYGTSYSIGSSQALNCLNIDNKSSFAGGSFTYCVDYADKQVSYTNSYSLTTDTNDNDEMTLTAEEMLNKENFSKLDFKNIWFLDTTTGVNHPQLMSNPVKIGEPAVFLNTTERFVTLDIDNTYELKIDIYPEVSTETLTYTSSDEAVATVSEEGIITAHSSGNSLIVITSTNGKITKCYLTVKEHSYETSITTPTCTEQGYTTYTCECGDTYVSDYVKENGHSHTATVTTPATHLTEGVMTYTCACGDTYTEAITKTTEHTYSAVVTAPTCTEQGYTTYTCACGDTYVSDYVKANGHSHNAEITTPATHLTEGLMTFTCACGDTYTEAIAKTTEHTYNAVVTAPTCTEKGYTTYTCECGDSYVADYVDATGHSHTTTVTTPATHLAEGLMTHTCACGDTYTEVIAKTTTHTFTEEILATPTCTEKGEKLFTCECGYSYTEEIAKTNHINTNGDFACDECETILCSHMCHQSGFMGFIWKIINFFQKLFGMNPVCVCGAAHY